MADGFGLSNGRPRQQWKQIWLGSSDDGFDSGCVVNERPPGLAHLYYSQYMRDEKSAQQSTVHLHVCENQVQMHYYSSCWQRKNGGRLHYKYLPMIMPREASNGNTHKSKTYY
ncbi:hypothetical protein Dimus_012934 [Dionaea muscipula]